MKIAVKYLKNIHNNSESNSAARQTYGSALPHPAGTEINRRGGGCPTAVKSTPVCHYNKVFKTGHQVGNAITKHKNNNSPSVSTPEHKT